MLKDQGETPEQIATRPHPFYTPIATFASSYELEPVAYGLKFAGALSGGAFIADDLSSKLQTAGVNATAYAAKLPGGEVSLIILNKDADKDLTLTLDFGSGRRGAVETETLHAPALNSREAHITPAKIPGALKEGKYSLTVPRVSGIRITVR